MDFKVKSGSLDSLKAECLIVQVYGDGAMSAAAETTNAMLDGGLKKYLSLGDLTLKPGKCAWLPSPDTGFQRLLLVCMGQTADTTTADDVKASAAAVTKAIKSKEIKSAVWSVEAGGAVSIKNFATIVAREVTTGVYAYTQTRTQDVKPSLLKKMTFHSLEKSDPAWKAGSSNGQALGEGINYTRELGNLPANICTPIYLGKQAEKLAAESGDAITTSVLDEKQMKKLGMGALLSVGVGSEQPPRLIAMEYRGGDKKEAPTVLVGKGITFDTGGISIKPGPAMDEMKFDMCGAATLFGVMKTLSLLKPKVNVIALVAAAENMPSGRATKPGDVVTTMSGQTVEILNTDAEGRLVLCDALTYASRYKPGTVIDIATLTGACVIALGNHASGLFANDQTLADELLSAGLSAQDKAWQLPLWDEYQKSLSSNFADMANIGGREAGSITAACFLSRYTKDFRWAHLDIAGTAWTSGAAKGATGRPVSLLVQHLLGLFE